MMSSCDITCTLKTFLQNQYDPIDVDDDCVNAMKGAARPDPPKSYGEILEKPIDTAEIYNPIRLEGRNIIREAVHYG